MNMSSDKTTQTTTGASKPPTTIRSTGGPNVQMQSRVHSALRIANNPRLAAAAFLALFSAVYFALIPLAAANRAFWSDELFTVFVASRPTVASIWQALLAGMDLHPPLDYIVRHFALLVPGPPELVLRIPSILALYLVSLAVFVYAKSAHSPLAGVCALTFFALSPAINFSIEARGYALLLLLTAATLLLWRRISNAPTASVGIWVALGGCVGLASWAHYYGMFLLFPLAAGGAALWISRRRFPWRLLFSFGVALALIAVIVPFAMRARQYASHFWATPPGLSVAAGLTVRHYGGGVTLFVCFALLLSLLGLRTPESIRSLPQWPLAERSFLCAMVLLPTIQWAAAKLITHAFDPRYTIESVIAGSVLIGILAGALAEGTAMPAGIVALLCLAVAAGGLVFFPADMRKSAEAEFNGVAGLWGRDTGYTYTRSAALAQVQSIEQLITATTLPILSPQPQTYLVQFYYGSPELRRRLILPVVDEDTWLRFVGYDTESIALRNLSRFIPLRLEPYDRIIDDESRIFLTRGKYTGDNWLVRKLITDGYRVQLATGNGGAAMECFRPSGEAGF
jgi:hypothetical protein